MGEEAEWTPEFEGQRPPFEPGNELGLQHGAYSPRYVEPLAAELLAAMVGDEQLPGHVRAPAYRLELMALCRAEAQIVLVSEWLATQVRDDGGVPDFGDERVRSAYLLLHRAEGRAGSARTRLGLTPAAAARLGKHVAQGQAANVDVALRMAQLHEAEERLRAEGWTPPPASEGGEG